MNVLRGLIVALTLPCAALPGGAQDLRQEFLRQIDRPRVALAPVRTPPEEIEGFRQERFSYASDSATRIAGLLVTPREPAGPRPTVVLLHPTGGDKHSMMSYAREFNKRGLNAVMIDARSYGGSAPGPAAGKDAYLDSLASAYERGDGQPFLFDPAWDVMRLLDFLQLHPEVDMARVGLLGNSKGGMEGVLVAAADERIRAAAPLIGVQSFRYGLEHDRWQARIASLEPAVSRSAARDGSVLDARFALKFYGRVSPGLADRFDFPAMLPLIAPRALLVVTGDKDPRNPLPGVQQCIAAARLSYANAGAAGELKLIVQTDTGHSVTKEARAEAIAWLVEKLR